MFKQHTKLQVRKNKKPKEEANPTSSDEVTSVDSVPSKTSPQMPTAQDRDISYVSDDKSANPKTMRVYQAKLFSH